MLPFTPEAFANVFAIYNQAIWPNQFVAWGLGAAALWAIFAKKAWGARVIFAILALLWMWTGAAYHLLYFTKINPAAYIFGLAFVIEAVLLAFFAFRPSRFRFALRNCTSVWIASGLIAYGLVIYPLATLLWKHHYPITTMFGVRA